MILKRKTKKFRLNPAVLFIFMYFLLKLLAHFDSSTLLAQTLQKIMERQKEAMEKQKEDLRIEKAKRQRIESAATGSLNKFEQVFIVFHIVIKLTHLA